MDRRLLYAVAGTAAVGVASWRTLWPWLPYDVSMWRRERHGARRVPSPDTPPHLVPLLIDRFEDNVARQPHKPCIVFEEGVYTWALVDQMANRVAQVCRERGVTRGSTVALLLHNQPAFVWCFLGLQKLGAVTAHINYNLKGRPLLHSVVSSGATLLLVGDGEDLYENVSEVAEQLSHVQIYIQGRTGSQLPAHFRSFDDAMEKVLPVPVCRSVRQGISLDDTACFIYTSGTTGLPKPAFIQHWRTVMLAISLDILDLCPQDRVYITLPLYHSAGGGYGLFSVLDVGAVLVLRRKFSASHFWEDVRKYHVTVILYIGELCRYLLAQPKSVQDTQHQVRVAYGNGLRKDIWEEFQDRFRIPEICEFFGATEGLCRTVNFFRRPGAIGRISPLLKRLDAQRRSLVRVDPSTAMPARDSRGRCVETGPGETGLFLCAIPPGFLEKNQFYKATKDANEKKVVRNVFREGDAFFNFGDLFYMDEDYFIYFADRLGDTFRWKGENVSTTEVANVLTQLDFLHDANVYGVTVPGHDGRAGMAAVVLREQTPLTAARLQALYVTCQQQLPPYARPLFLRQLPAAHETGTFKHQKTELATQGFHPRQVSDPLFFLDHHRQTYSPLDEASLHQLLTRSRL